MKAIAIDRFGGPEVVKLVDLPAPEPKPNEVQIAVAYAGVNPVDWKIREGLLKDRLQHIFPIILGWDVSGKVSKVGSDVKNFKVGEEVFAYARKSVVHDGAFAEFICLESQHVSKKPSKIGFREAAAIPLVALTAWQALVEWGNVQKGETVLIHAGAGGVGNMGIQFAKLAGAKVFTTASAPNHAYVKQLGADVAIDYRKEDFVTKTKQLAPNGIDLVFDCKGGETLKASFSVLKKGGRIVSIVEPISEDLGKKNGVKVGYVFVRPEEQHLNHIAELIDSGKLKLPLITEYSLQQAGEALEKVREGHTHGKIVLRVRK